MTAEEFGKSIDKLGPMNYIGIEDLPESITLDGRFSLEQLELVVEYMKDPK